MKKLLLCAASIAMLGFVSCGDEETDPADIKTEDIKSACDCVDAMEQVADRMLELMDGEETKEAEDEYEKLEEKMNEIGKHCTTEFKREEAEECDNYDSVSDKIRKVR